MEKTNNHISSNFKKLIIGLNDIKSFFIVYFLFLVLFITYEYFSGQVNNFESIVLMTIILSLIGIFILLFYNKFRYDNLYKAAFLIILMFGIVSVFLTPIVDVCDETEHFWRAEILAGGELFPHYVEIPNSNSTGEINPETGIANKDYYQSHGYQSIYSLKPLYPLTGSTVFDTEWDTQSINESTNYVSSAFAQNPFYGYIAQAIGILLAKLFDLNNIWMLWFGRLFNLILYSSICAIAVKKAPIFKIQLLLVGCLPLAIYQAGSLSIDPMVNGLSLLTVSYFLYMYKAPDESLDWKNSLVFFIIALLGGLTKVTYMALLLLIFLVPKNKFKNRLNFIESRLAMFFVIFLGLLWSGLFASSELLNSWRGMYFLNHHVSVSGQLIHILNTPLESLWLLFDPMNLVNMFNGLFSFANLPYYYSLYLSTLYAIFFILVTLFYPNNTELSKKFRIGFFIIGSIIFIGTFLVQYLTWCSVGAVQIRGVFGRYFIPLLIIPPLVFSLRNKERITNNIDFWTISILISFIGASLLLTTIKYY